MIYPYVKELLSLIEKKLITQRVHPTIPLAIYNYTAAGQVLPPSEWSPALRDCRGLILAQDGEIIARPFPKFWNYEQMFDVMPAEQPVSIQEKLDGSLGIVANYRDELIVATRGSFESEQARWFARWLPKGFLPNEGETFLFEILYPTNRIVVDYGDRAEGVLLGALKNEDATDLDPFDVARVAAAWNFQQPTVYDDPGTLADLASSMDDNRRFDGQEGFVARFANGLRVKLKLTDYKRLHRLITQCSTRTIWELLRSGKSLSELLEKVPSDFSEWVADTANGLTGEFERIMGDAKVAFRFRTGGRSSPENRRDFAEWAKKQPHSSLLFSLLDGKDITDAVWKLVEPEWATPFRVERTIAENYMEPAFAAIDEAIRPWIVKFLKEAA